MSASSAGATIAERNAANAQHSTGPVTAEGKARSAQNAIRHGLSGRSVVLPHESQGEYDALKLTFIEENRPGTILEMQLLIRMVDCWWRLARAMRVEAEFLAQRSQAISEASPNLTGDAALVSLFSDPTESRSFRLFMRYLTNAQNQWRAACKEYDQTRQARIERERESEERMLAPNNAPKPGFVSHAASSGAGEGSVTQSPTPAASGALPPHTAPHSANLRV